ncbi:MAG: DUF5050 domain-containing protein [Clostridia bacterium]|nr:DUF5050 domain-containing protein [Clostridia bacterium]
MKKQFIAILSAMLISGSAFALCSCSGGTEGTTPPTESHQPSDDTGKKPDTKPTTPALKKFEGLTMDGNTVTYDGQAHPLSVDGTLPSGAAVKYSDNNNYKDAGEYTVTATVSDEGYEDLKLTAKLTINKAVITGLKFESQTYSYDNTAHSVEVVGVLPEGTKVTYSCKENKNVTNSAKESGVYTITATVTNKNYETYTAQATLTIKGEDKEHAIYSHGGKLYFGNALDGDRLYSYSSGEGVKKVSGDVPRNFTVMGGELYFRSYSLFGSSVKTADDGGVNTVISAKGEYLCTDESNLYYAVNGLTQAKSGIYKVNLSGDEPTATKISEGKAKYLAYYGGNLYFADGKNGDKLSKVSVSGGERTQVVDEKITCLEKSGSALYYTVNNLLGDYIERYDISTGTRRKLTSDAGANLTVIGTKLYYINVDLLNSYLYGKGIYSVDANPAVNNNNSGTKLLGDDMTVYSSLTAVDGKLAYYRVNDQMLCTNSTNGNSEVEILNGFVAPEVTPLSTGSKTLAYGKSIYFMDLYNDKALYCYDTTSQNISRITSNKVSDFSILGDTLYYNAVSYGVNNDLYKVDLKMGGEPELVSKNDCEYIVSDGTNLYYVYSNAAGAKTAIHKIDAQGVDTEIYTKGAEYLTYYDGYIYFVDGSDLLKMPTTGYTVDGTAKVTDKNVDTFVISNGVVYFRETYGLGTQKRLSRVNVDGTGYTAMMTKSTDPLDICVYGNTVYYYNDLTIGTSGIFSVSINAKENETPKLILENQNKYYARSLSVIDGKIYFISYRLNVVGDSHLYSVEIANGKVEKIA